MNPRTEISGAPCSLRDTLSSQGSLHPSLLARPPSPLAALTPAGTDRHIAGPEQVQPSPNCRGRGAGPQGRARGQAPVACLTAPEAGQHHGSGHTARAGLRPSSQEQRHRPTRTRQATRHLPPCTPPSSGLRGGCPEQQAQRKRRQRRRPAQPHGRDKSARSSMPALWFPELQLNHRCNKIFNEMLQKPHTLCRPQARDCAKYSTCVISFNPRPTLGDRHHCGQRDQSRSGEAADEADWGLQKAEAEPELGTRSLLGVTA